MDDQVANSLFGDRKVVIVDLILIHSRAYENGQRENETEAIFSTAQTHSYPCTNF